MYSSIDIVRRINIETVEQWTREALRCCFIVKPDCSNIIWVDIGQEAYSLLVHGVAILVQQKNSPIIDIAMCPHS